MEKSCILSWQTSEVLSGEEMHKKNVAQFFFFERKAKLYCKFKILCGSMLRGMLLHSLQPILPKRLTPQLIGMTYGVSKLQVSSVVLYKFYLHNTKACLPGYAITVIFSQYFRSKTVSSKLCTCSVLVQHDFLRHIDTRLREKSTWHFYLIPHEWELLQFQMFAG